MRDRIGSLGRSALGAALAGCLLLPAASASAATPVGQLFAPDSPCTSGQTLLQTLVTSGTAYTFPAAGVITSWSWEPAAATNPGLKLKVGRPAGGLSYQIVGEALAGAQTPNTATTYLARIPVQAGDVLGIYDGSTGNDCQTNVGGTNVFVNDDEAPGSTSTYTSEPGKLPVQAIVEPDADGDGYGDETQAKADLGIAKSAPVVARVGRNITYRLTVTNDGPEAAPGVVVNDPLPASTTFVSVSSTSGACDSTVTCSLGTVWSGGSVTITIVARTTQLGRVTNAATIDSQALDTAARNYPGRGDTNAANNSANATTTALLPPVLSGVSQKRRRWSEPGHFKLYKFFTRMRPPVGTAFNFTLDRAAVVRFDFTQPAPGRKVNGRCVAPNKHNARRRRCTRMVVRGSLSIGGHAGANTVQFYGWLSRGWRLRPGRYTLILTASTPGVGSTSRKLTFTIVR